MSVENYIKTNVSSLSEKVYIAPEIPEKKLNNAITAIAPGVDPDYVLAIVDSTLFGSAKEGFVFLGDTLYTRGIMEKPKEYKFEHILKAEYRCTEKIKDNGKVEKKEDAFLYLDNGTTATLAPLVYGINYEKFAELINGIIDEAGEDKSFVTTSQTIPLASMDDAIKTAYIKIICNFAYDDDGTIDAKEYAEIISLIVRIDYNAEDRIKMRSYMCDVSSKEDTDLLLQYLKENVEEGSFDILKKSLIKDIIYIFRIKNKFESWKNNEFITELQHKLQISDEQIDIIAAAIKNDEDILSQRKNDSQIKEAMKDLGAKAGAVGVPLAAIYFSGSVIGMSAAGITSGLATLGMGGLLGFSGMFTGIGVAVLMGVGAYKGIKKITGISELENNKQRELMLQAIIKNSQKSLNYLIEDVNEISKQLADELEKGMEASIKIKKLSKLLGMMSKGAQAATQKINHAEEETIISQLPQILDIVRLEELTKEATREKLRSFVLSCYIEKEVSINDEEQESDDINNGNIKNQFVLRDQLPLNTLEQLYSIFENIGYNNVKDAALATAKGTAKNIFNNIFGQ